MAATAIFTAPARAADMPVKAAPFEYVPVWSGFYGGFHAGYGWGKKVWIDNFPTFDGEIDATPKLAGAVAGLQGGWNHQWNWLVLGVEADLTWSDVKKKNYGCFFFGDQVCSSRSEWFGSVAARVGVAYGPALFYAKGGAAWVQDRYDNLATCAGTQPTSRAGVNAACGVPFVGNQLRPGWLVGVGVEYFFAPNWSAKLEYNHMDFGARSVPFSDGAAGFFTEFIKQRVDVVKVGINYHFNTPYANLVSARAADPSSTDDSGGSVVVFTVLDVAKYSVAGAIGTFMAPAGNLDASGVRFYLMGEGGVYKYRGGGELIRGNYQSADILAGYAFEGDFYSINLLAGLSAIHHALADVDTTNRVQGTEFGLKVRADAYINPTAATLVYGEAEYSTAFNTYGAKFKLGYDVGGGKEMFLGPMIAIYGNERWHQFRAGVHLTELKYGRVSFDLSGGYADDSLNGGGAFASVIASTKW